MQKYAYGFLYSVEGKGTQWIVDQVPQKLTEQGRGGTVPLLQKVEMLSLFV
jgi:hypothetical protein